MTVTAKGVGFGQPKSKSGAQVLRDITEQKLTDARDRHIALTANGEGLPTVVTKSVDDDPGDRSVGDAVATEVIQPEESAPESKGAAKSEEGDRSLDSRLAALESKMTEQQDVLASKNAELETELGQATGDLSAERSKSADLGQKLVAAQEEVLAAKDGLARKEAEVALLEKALETQGDRMDALEKMWNEQGAVSHPSPDEERRGVNLNTGVSRDPQVLKDLQRIFDNSPALGIHTQKGIELQRDTREFDAFVRTNRRGILDALQTQLRAKGFLQGASVIRKVSDTADLPHLLLPVLSSELREVRSDQFVFAQFTREVRELGRAPGMQVNIPRFKNLDAPTSIADYELGVSDVLGTTYTDISERQVICTIKELGRGKNAAPPVAISTFLQRYSILDLEGEMYRALGQNYHAVTDLQIRALFATANYVVYSNGDGLVTTPGEVVTGGTFGRKQMIELLRVAQDLRLPPMPDGRYVLVLNTRQLAQLASDLDDTAQNLRVDGSDVVSEMFSMATGANRSAMSGYYGDLGGFHLFCSNAFANGAPGTEGVQDEVLGTGSTTTRTGYMFGLPPVGRGVGMPMEIRLSEVNNYQRTLAAIWTAHEGYVPLDINEDTATHSYTGVVAIHTTDMAIGA